MRVISEQGPVRFLSRIGEGAACRNGLNAKAWAMTGREMFGFL